MMTLSSTTRSGLQIAGLWSLAVAQPLYAVLQGNPEFFVAYRATFSQLVAFVAFVSVAAPLVLFAIRWCVGLLSPKAGTVLQVVLLSVCCAASPLMRSPSR